MQTVEMSALLLQLGLCVVTLVQLTSGGDDDGTCEQISNVLKELVTLTELQTMLSQIETDVAKLIEQCGNENTKGELKKT